MTLNKNLAGLPAHKSLSSGSLSHYDPLYVPLHTAAEMRAAPTFQPFDMYRHTGHMAHWPNPHTFNAPFGNKRSMNGYWNRNGQGYGGH
jgi:hypothetical protein